MKRSYASFRFVIQNLFKWTWFGCNANFIENELFTFLIWARNYNRCIIIVFWVSILWHYFDFCQCWFFIFKNFDLNRFLTHGTDLLNLVSCVPESQLFLRKRYENLTYMNCFIFFQKALIIKVLRMRNL